MMKKILSVLAALVMLVLPVISCAEGGFLADALAAGKEVSTTVSFTVGDFGEDAKPIVDLFNALTLNMTGNKEQAHLGIGLQGEEVVTADFKTEGDSLYLTSTLLGEKTVAVSEKELQQLLETIIKMIPEETMAQLQAFLNGAGQQTGAITDEEMKPIIDIIAKWVQKVESEQGEFTSDSHDPAIVKATLVITGEEYEELILAVINMLENNEAFSGYVKTLLESQNVTLQVTGAESSVSGAAANVLATGEEEAPAEAKPMTVEEFFAELRTQVSAACKTVKTLNAVAYINDKGESVAVDAWADTTTDLKCTLTYNRLTDGEKVNHDVLFVLTNGTENAVIGLNIADWHFIMGAVDAEDKLTDGMDITGTVKTTDTEAQKATAVDTVWKAMDGDEVITFGINYSAVTDYKGDKAENVTSFSVTDGKDTNYVTVTANTLVDDIKLPEINIADAVHPLSMTGEELEALGEEISSSAIQNYLGVLFSLPESTFGMLVNSQN
ncbi:MAG: hypothetical protein Q4C54_02095 [Clostridia bacterium]|nr:hypothetical protein [Clostridia bacterium]